MHVPRVTVAVGLAMWLAACSTPAATPTSVPPTAAATAQPAGTPVPTLDANAFDIQDAFLTNVNDLTNEVEMLATAQCADLTAETQANPTEVTEMRGFAATLQRVSTQQQALSTSDDVKSSLADLSKAFSQLDTQLTTCGIKAP